jgi:uncharacterized protein with HEPN domain
MHPKSPKLLEDIRKTCDFLSQNVEDETISSYLGDRRLRLSAERALEIIGEALLRLRRIDPATLQRITEYQEIIAVRNRLAHGYDEETIDTIIWNAKAS